MASVFTKRIIAYIMDFFVVSAFMWIISYLLSLVVAYNDFYSVYRVMIVVVPILIMVYFVFCEKTFGATVGKSLMMLQVKSKNGYDINWAQAIVRNLSKIYWFPILFDWLIGKILHKDRILNEITKTTVIEDY